MASKVTIKRVDYKQVSDSVNPSMNKVKNPPAPRDPRSGKN